MKLKLVLVFLSLVVFSCQTNEKKSELGTMTEEELITKTKEIHESVMTLDTHCDINVKNFTAEKNYTSDLSSQVTLPKMKHGGLDVAWFVVYTGQGELNEDGYKKAYENAIAKFDAIHNLCEKFAPNEIGLAVNSKQARALHKEGKLVAMIGVENAYPIAEDLSRIKEFYDRGARYMSLSHNGHSQFCDSNTGEADDVWLHGGLSELGKQAVVEMNKVGIMIDVSHPAKSSIAQMLEVSKAPIIASHSSARALCGHSRNLDDDQLKAIAAGGGVVQAVAFGTYVNTKKGDAFNEYKKSIRKEVLESQGKHYYSDEEYDKLSMEQKREFWSLLEAIQDEVNQKMANDPNAVPRVNVSDFVDHIDYMVDLIGIDHVGISSDFDGGGGIEGWNNAAETFNVTKELVKRGYSEEEIRKLWADNLLRVLDEVQAVADNWGND